jgi:predicted nucleic acid-binding protein
MSDAPRTIFVAEPAARYLARLPVVVDSSLICAVLFDELQRDEARAQLDGRQLVAPRLLDYEVVNVAVQKQRRGLTAAAAERALSDYLAQQIELVNTELAAQFALAARYHLSAYDAAYLWLAGELKAPLATFDRKLGEAAQRHLHALD